jgi:competence protein ComEC
VLLAWNPYTLFDPGFELSFAAVVAIFVFVAPLRRLLEGYPLPRFAVDAIAVSTACGVATAPVLWLQFHAIPLFAVPANVLAAPAVMPMLALALSGAVLAPIAPAGTSVAAWLNGWLAAYLATCARIVGSAPGAQIRSSHALLLVLAGTLLLAAYAWPRWQASSSRST